MSAHPVILLVDDDRDLLAGLSLALARSDRSVISCQDIESAKLLIEALPITHIVSDVRLTGPFEYEGLGLVQYLRERSPETVAILMTGAFTPELATEAQNRGSVAVLQKPFSIDDLEAVLDRFERNAPHDGLPELMEIPLLDEIIASD
ncbi:MAG TPA: response regulator, partial [Thermoanaerobaculia bacterium]|nr:response regulator [Thermoanaerobaculia bacterium]